MRTFLRWAGSKSQLLPILRNYWRNHFDRYIEPFSGSATVFFDVEPKQAILGDLNVDLIQTLRAIQLDAERVIECIRRLPLGDRNYYRIRQLNPSILSVVEQAARFLYLNFYCFNGLYRTNRQGQFNVPFGRKKGRKTVDEDLIRSGATLLKRAVLVYGDFSETLRYAGPRDFVYLDPPYITTSRDSFREYLPQTFESHDLLRLRDELGILDRQGTKFVLSYCDSREARKLLAVWRTRSVTVRRNIAGFVGKRKTVREIIVTNI